MAGVNSWADMHRWMQVGSADIQSEYLQASLRLFLYASRSVLRSTTGLVDVT